MQCLFRVELSKRAPELWPCGGAAGWEGVQDLHSYCCLGFLYELQLLALCLF